MFPLIAGLAESGLGEGAAAGAAGAAGEGATGAAGAAGEGAAGAGAAGASGTPGVPGASGKLLSGMQFVQGYRQGQNMTNGSNSPSVSGGSGWMHS